MNNMEKQTVLISQMQSILSRLSRFVKVSLAAIWNVPLKLYVLNLVFWLLILNRPIPEWLLKRVEQDVNPVEILPDPYVLKRDPEVILPS